MTGDVHTECAVDCVANVVESGGMRRVRVRTVDFGKMSSINREPQIMVLREVSATTQVGLPGEDCSHSVAAPIIAWTQAKARARRIVQSGQHFEPARRANRRRLESQKRSIKVRKGLSHRGVDGFFNIGGINWAGGKAHVNCLATVNC